jgi:23S rRNA pseudouridine2605 synthase
MSKTTTDTEEKRERIAKVMARAGLCSRRDAEKWILSGRVQVNNEVLTTPAFTVTPKDEIIVDGEILPAPSRTRLWRFHKPVGLVTTHRDEQGRTNIFEVLPPELPRVVSVGRLDITSEGLLLLTNDGTLARELEHPSRGWVRRYRVRVHGGVEPKSLTALKNGVTVEGARYGPITAALDSDTDPSKSTPKRNVWVSVALTEGKNREVRKIMAHLGLTVSRLIRVSYGPFQLGKLAPGVLEEVPATVIKQQLGSAAPAGLSTPRRKS